MSTYFYDTTHELEHPKLKAFLVYCMILAKTGNKYVLKKGKQCKLSPDRACQGVGGGDAAALRLAAAGLGR